MSQSPSIQLATIYRYPVKGFSAQELASVQVTKGKPLPWDRAFAIENGDSGFEPTNPNHISKSRFMMLMKQPELARLRTSFDPETGTFSISENGKTVAEGNLLVKEGHSEIETFLASYCDKPLRGNPKILYSAGHAFTDSRTQDLSLINLASVQELSQKAGAELDPIRFRGNLYISGMPAWQENDLVGQTLTIGEVTFLVRKRTQRCAATNANPQTGIADQKIPKLLLQTYDHADCGIHLVAQTSGMIKQGDSVKINP